jgi:hypothetical protein
MDPQQEAFLTDMQEMVDETVLMVAEHDFPAERGLVVCALIEKAQDGHVYSYILRAASNIIDRDALAAVRAALGSKDPTCGKRTEGLQ